MSRSENRVAIAPRHRRATALAAATLAAALAFAPKGFADNPPTSVDVGHSTYVLNTVNGQPPRAQPVVIRLNDKIVFEEEVAAGHEAKTTIEFRDGSLFSLGPDAKARIDSFIFDPQNSTSHKALAVTHGVFRYLSGFASRDQEAKIEVPSGTLGIRGSLVLGVVTPGAPDFLFVAEGKAVFKNDAGEVDIDAGQGIAILSRRDQPMEPKTMPPGVAAQVLRAILKMLPSSKGLLAESEGNTELLIAEGKANLLSAKSQEKLERERHQEHGRGASEKGGSIAGEFPLLVEAGKLGLFDGKRGRHHGNEEILFLAKLGPGNDAGRDYLRKLVKEAADLHHENAGRALRVVGRGVTLVTLIGAQNDPRAAAKALQEAINALRVNTAAAGHLVSLFADLVSETSECDAREAKELGAALRKVLRDPRNADLRSYAPNFSEQGTTLISTQGVGRQEGPPNGGPVGGNGAFGSFGSSAGSGVSTSPAI